MNDMCLELLNELKIPFYFVQNSININRGNAYGYSSKEELILKMQKDVSNGKKFFGVFDTKKQMEIAVQTLNDYAKSNGYKFNYRAYSSDEGDKKDLLNVNKVWKDSYVFYTPSVTIGISYDSKDDRNVYLFSESCTVNANTLVQMCARCRNMNELHYYAKVKYGKFKYNDIDDVKAYYNGIVNGVSNNTIMNCNQTYFDIDSGKEIMREDIFNTLYYWNTYYESQIRYAYRENFEHKLKEAGYNVKQNIRIENSKALDTIKSSMDNAKSVVKSNREKSIDNALYKNESELSVNEKRMRSDMMVKSGIIGICFDNMEHKKRFREFIINKRGFERYRSYQFMKMTKSRVDKLADEHIKENGEIKSIRSTIIKVSILMQTNSVLETKAFHVKKVSNKSIPKPLLTKIHRSFRIKIDGLGSKDILCKMYVGLFGKEIIKKTKDNVKIINPEYIKRFKIR
jgi:hypothetical protein